MMSQQDSHHVVPYDVECLRPSLLSETLLVALGNPCRANCSFEAKSHNEGKDCEGQLTGIKN